MLDREDAVVAHHDVVRAGISVDDRESLAGLAYKTAGRSNYFTYNADAKVVSRKDHWRVNPQLYYYYGPFGLMGEYAVSKQTVEGTVGGAERKATYPMRRIDCESGEFIPR